MNKVYNMTGVSMIEYPHQANNPNWAEKRVDEYISFRDMGIATYKPTPESEESKGVCIKVYMNAYYEANIIKDLFRKNKVYIFYNNTRISYRLFESIEQAMHFVVSDYLRRSLIEQMARRIGSDLQEVYDSIDGLFAKVAVKFDNVITESKEQVLPSLLTNDTGRDV